MAWYNASWLRRKAITLTGGSSGAQSAYQLKLTVTYDSDMKSDFSDLRFTKADGTTLIDSWLESHTASTSAIVWVETDTPANTVDADIYCYYGNSGAASAWDGDNTFLVFDDFPGSSLDTTNTWDTRVGSPTVAGGILSVPSGTGIETKTDYNTVRVRSRANIPAQNLNLHGIYDGATAQGAYFRTESTTNRVRTRDASSYTTTTTTATYTGSYNILEVRKITSTSAKFYVNDVLDQTHTTHVPNVSYPVGFECNNGTQLIDWVFAAKYVANPATYAFGSEESAPSGTVVPILNHLYNLLRG